MSDLAADLLDATYNVISVQGHHKGAMYAGYSDTAACLVGAMSVGRARLFGDVCAPEASEAWGDAIKALAKHLGLDVEGLVAWNDAPERTQDEILDALAKTSWNLREGLL